MTSQGRPRLGDRGEEVVRSGALSCSLEVLALERTLGGLPGDRGVNRSMPREERGRCTAAAASSARSLGVSCGPPDLPAQDLELVPKHQQLNVLHVQAAATSNKRTSRALTARWRNAKAMPPILPAHARNDATRILAPFTPEFANPTREAPNASGPREVRLARGASAARGRMDAGTVSARTR